MRSIEQNIENALKGFPQTITYTDRPKERASVEDSGIYANSFATVGGHFEQARQKYVRYNINLSLYQHKVKLIGDCNGDEDEYFKRIKKRIDHFESILLDVFSLLFSENSIKIFNTQIDAAFAELGVTDPNITYPHKIGDHSCPAEKRPRSFCYMGPCTSFFIRAFADLNGLSESELIDFVSINFEVWTPISGLACCSLDGKFVAVNNIT